jgi:hypothetical protein
MAFTIVHAACNGSYTAPKVGQSVGSVGANGFSVATNIRMDLTTTSYNDLRLNSFASSSWHVEMCNRTGSAGTAGTGKHWAYGIPVPAVTGDAGLVTYEKAALSVIANPYATVYYNGFMYINDFDHPDIYAVNIPAFTLANRGVAVYSFPAVTGKTCSGVDLEVVGTKLYALYSINTNFNAPYDSGVVVRLAPVTANAAPLSSDGQVDVGANPTGMVTVNYTPNGEEDARNYLFVSCVGGAQTPDQGNGAASMISLVQITDDSDFETLTSPLVGTYAPPAPEDAYSDATPTLDIKAVAATPQSTCQNATGDQLPAGDSFIYVMATAYVDEDLWQTRFMVCQVKASRLIENALAATPVVEDLSNAANYKRVIDVPVEGGEDNWGYFWTLAFAPDGSSCQGYLIVGRGDPNPANGTFLEVYTSGDSGAAGSAATTRITTQALYGANGCALNSMTVIPTAAPISKLRSLAAVAPAPVASGSTSMSAFVEERRKKAKSRKK